MPDSKRTMIGAAIAAVVIAIAAYGYMTLPTTDEVAPEPAAQQAPGPSTQQVPEPSQQAK